MDKKTPAGRKLQGKKAGINRVGGERPFTPRFEFCIFLAASMMFAGARPLMAATAPAASEQEMSPSVKKSDETAGKEQKLNLRMAIHLNPLRVGGESGYDVRSDKTGDRTTMRYGMTTKVRIGTTGYVWQPWFARIGGNLIFNMSNSTINSTGQGETGGRIDQKNNSVNGDFRLSLLPQSRFPFDGYFEKSDSRQTGNLGISDEYASQRFGFTQVYQTLQGDRYWGGFNRNTTTSVANGMFQQDNLSAEMSKSLDKQNFSMSGNRNVSTHDASAERSTLNLLSARHNYTPDPTISVESQANITQSDYLFAAGQSSARLLQLNSSAFWRPEDHPLTVTGGIRMFGMTSSAGEGASTNVRSGNANVGAYYEVDKHIRVNGSVNANLTDSGGRRSMSSNQSLGASYQADTVSFREFTYTKTASVSGSNSVGDEASSQQVSLQLSHSLSRNIDLASYGNIGLNVSQSGGVSKSSTSDAPQTLSHSGSLTWSLSQGQGQTYFRASASDSRSLGGTQDTSFQMINLQLSSNQPLNNRSALNGNLTIQSTRQTVGGELDAAESSFSSGNGDFVTTSSADLNYSHSRAFNIPRLRFASAVRMNNSAFLPIITGPQDMAQKSWENRFDYSIGRTQLTLSELMSQSSGVLNMSIWLVVKRQFGD